MAQKGADLLCRTLHEWKAGLIEPRSKEEALATNAPPLKGRIASEMAFASRQIVNTIRALDPWPGAFAFYYGKRVKCFKGSLLHWSGEEKGLVMAGDQQALFHWRATVGKWPSIVWSRVVGNRFPEARGFMINARILPYQILLKLDQKALHPNRLIRSCWLAIPGFILVAVKEWYCGQLIKADTTHTLFDMSSRKLLQNVDCSEISYFIHSIS